MERNAEVETTVRDLMSAMNRGDVEAFTGGLSADLTAGIGTDDEEWWEGYDATAAAVKAQLEVSGGLPFEGNEPRGYAVGEFGWFENRGTINAGKGQPVPVRMTGVLRQEDGQWRLLQMHASIGTPNADVGMENLPV
jgi:ketosteroid isomerase-like protein